MEYPQLDVTYRQGWEAGHAAALAERKEEREEAWVLLANAMPAAPSDSARYREWHERRKRWCVRAAAPPDVDTH